MLDLKAIRSDASALRARLEARSDGGPEMERAIDRLLALDEERREVIGEGDELKARRNAVSREIGTRKRAGDPADDLLAEMREVADRVRSLDDRRREIEGALDELLLEIPNPPMDDVPPGGEEANVVVRTWGERREGGDDVLPHWEIGERLGVLDLPAGARVAGSGFPLYRGMGARLQRALVGWMIDLHTREHGYEEIAPPFLVHRDAMIGTGQLPKFEADSYRVESDDLFLIPTAEVPVTNVHRGEILEPGTLPIGYVAYSPCFRREAGSAGKDTRGLIRVHQFDKVELVRFESADRSAEAHEELLGHAEAVLRALDLPYRVVLLAAGDTGFASAKTYDLEVWAPGVERWLEVSSCSNFLDFQARRADIRFRPAPGRKPEFVHTLNGSGLALPRTVIALLENGQQPDGSVLLPGCLHPYLGTDRLTPPH